MISNIRNSMGFVLFVAGILLSRITENEYIDNAINSLFNSKTTGGLCSDIFHVTAILLMIGSVYFHAKLIVRNRK